MKKFVVLLSIIFAVACLTPIVNAADVAKVGVVSYQTILNQSNGGIKMKEQIRAKSIEREQKLNKLKEELDKEQKKLQRDSILLAPDKFKERKRELRIKINDWKTLQQDSTVGLKAYEDKMLKQFQLDISGIVKQIGTKEGYLLILDRNSGGVAYFPSQIDITQKVMKIYNDKIAKNK